MHALRVSCASFRRIVKDVLFHPYKIVITQELKPTDYEVCSKFVCEMRAKL